MRRVIRIAAAGTWPKAEAHASATLPFVDRFRRRIALHTDDGSDVLLDEAEAVVLNDGDGLQLEDGTWLAIRAADEDVCDVTCESPEALARIAWHLGNRHLAVQIMPGALRIRDDHVIVDMLVRLGAQVVHRRAPFTPESGAYAKGHGHGHDHDHAHHG